MIQKIEALPVLTDNYVYVLSDESRRCLIVDPGDSAPVLAHVRREHLAVSGVLCTHHHADHVGGAASLAEISGAPVWCSRYDLPRIPAATEGLKHGQNFEVLGETVEVIEIPGHTLGHIAFHFPRLKAAFVGDTLFSCGCGRLFEGTAAQMFASLQELKRLSPDTDIYFGHEYTLKNIEFARTLKSDPGPPLDEYAVRSAEKRSRDLPTTPARLEDELRLNPFLLATTVEEFAYVRALRNVF